MFKSILSKVARPKQESRSSEVVLTAEKDSAPVDRSSLLDKSEDNVLFGQDRLASSQQNEQEIPCYPSRGEVLE